ncbi:T9SS type A sorting domain-containing protein [Prolixibacteraceae bacterium JC049]|nr:T9SS type A sorting domain-containing protein [Prolixibacteraceae bacterium JC049]
MKKLQVFIIWLLISFLGINNVFAQYERYSIDEFIAKFDFDKRSQHNSYFIIDFKRIVSSQEKRDYAEKGIFINDYIGEYNYLVASSVSEVGGFVAMQQQNTRKQGDEFHLNKLSSALKKEEFPQYILKSEGRISIVASFLKTETKSNVRSALEKLGVNDFRIIHHFQQIEMTVMPEKLAALAQIPWIVRIEEGSEPIVRFDQLGRNSSGAMAVAHYNNSLKKYTGKGIKVGIWDGDVVEHIDLLGRVNINENGDAESPHGTHVAGVIAGRGLIKTKAKGMAEDVFLEAWNYSKQQGDLFNYEEMDKSANEQGITISQNSYGATHRGGDYPPYKSRNRAIDKLAVKHPELSLVFSAGNSQGLGKMFGHDGFRTVRRSAKNIITVGAVDRYRRITDFSSLGPTYNGRIAPLVSAYGKSVISTAYHSDYVNYDGTSQAAPLVSGIMAQLSQAYFEKYKTKPEANILKAIVCNSATDLGNAGPDFSYGFGMVNAVKALEAIDNEWFQSEEVAHLEQKEFAIEVPNNVAQFKVMLVWIDPVVDVDANIDLVNNLDLKVVSANNENHLPLVLNPQKETEIAQPGVDDLNNIEQVVVEKPVAGNYKIVIDGKKVVDGNQQFVIAYDFVYEDPQIIYPVDGITVDAGKTAIIECVTSEDKKTILEISYDKGSSYETIVETKNGIKSIEFKMPVDKALARLRLKQGSYKSETSDFYIIGTPQEIKANQLGDKEFQLSWKAVPMADSYEILKVGDGDIKLVKATEKTEVNIPMDASQGDWIAVRGVNKQYNVKGNRSDAVQIKPLNALSSLPITEDFESENSIQFKEIKGKNVASHVAFNVFSNRNHSLFIEGGKNEERWENDTDDQLLWSKNADFKYVLELGRVNVNDISDLIFSFDKLQIGGVNLKSNQLRVCVDGEPIADLLGNVFHKPIATQGEMFSHVYYDLNKYLKSNFKLSIEVLCKKKSVNGKDGDLVYIDNLKLDERRAHDVVLAEVLYPKTGTGLRYETITYRLLNLGKNDIQSTTVSYEVSHGRKKQSVEEVLNQPIKPLKLFNYTFKEKADFSSTAELYSLMMKATIANDDNESNNLVEVKKIDNYGDIVLMPKEGTVKVVTDDTIFTDPGSQKYFYPFLDEFGVAKFTPKNLTARLKVSFDEMYIANPYDSLYIYSGTNELKRLGAVSGEDKSQTFISDAEDGGLTFKFKGSRLVAWSGWVAKIKAVTKENLPSYKLKILKQLESINDKGEAQMRIRVANLGANDINQLDLEYVVDGENATNEKYTQKIKSGSYIDFVFAKKEDFSEYGSFHNVTFRVTAETENGRVEDNLDVVMARHYPDVWGEGQAYIKNVKLAEIDNASEYDGHRLYLNKVASLKAGGTYPLVVMGKSLYFPQSITVYGWADWDSNGQFDENEKITFTKKKDLFSASLVVPQNVHGYKRLRLRIFDINKNISPVGRYKYGEAEDYTLKITKNTSVPYSIEKTVRVFPNPATGSVFVEKANGNRLSIMTILGVQLMEKDIDSDLTQIDLSLFSKGVYLFVFSKDGERQVEKVIVN